MTRVFAALSGGVDSSVAAALLKGRGYDVVGIHMKMWAPQMNHEAGSMNHEFDTVCWQQQQDRLDAMRVAATLDIPFQTWDFSEDYRQAVVEYMIREYARGRTPNPDVMCNSRIKFGLFLRKALEAGADYIATGHYIRRNSEFPTINSKFSNLKIGSLENSLKIENCKLKIAKDLNKDQSYFLWTLTQEQLRHCLFPIGEYAKTEVREIARQRGLLTADKPDSQGVCFIGEIDVREFLAGYIPERRGRVLTQTGRVVGEHNGAEFYTIGQRQGLGIGGGIPYYVAEKDVTTNVIVVSEGPCDGSLFRRELTATDINWISDRPPAGGFPLRCEARIRYRQPLQPCKVTRSKKQEARSKSDDTMLHASCFLLHVRFDEPQRAVTPGQSIVFYQGQELLGGGIIA